MSPLFWGRPTRFFTPVAARFISPDSIVPNPASPQSLNRYTAMANNPLKFADPTGHQACIDPDDCEPRDYTGGGSGGGSSGGGWSGGGTSGGSNGSSGGVLPKPAKPKSASSGYDVTKWLVKFMNQMQNLPIAQTIRSLNKFSCSLFSCLAKFLAWILFADLVRNGAAWDIKIEMANQLGRKLVIGAEWFEYSPQETSRMGFSAPPSGSIKRRSMAALELRN